MSGRWSGLLWARVLARRCSPGRSVSGIGVSLCPTGPDSTRDVGRIENQQGRTDNESNNRRRHRRQRHPICRLSTQRRSSAVCRRIRKARSSCAASTVPQLTSSIPATSPRICARSLRSPPRRKKKSRARCSRIAEEDLGSGAAFEVDCLDLAREVFGGDLPEPFIKGFVVIRSNKPLRVTGVYTAASIDRQGEISRLRASMSWRSMSPNPRWPAISAPI